MRVVRPTLKDRLNFSVDGDVGVVEAVDRVVCARNAAEVKIAADVVVLVKRCEYPLSLGAIETKIGQLGGASVAAREGQILFDGFTKVHRSRSTRTRRSACMARW